MLLNPRYLSYCAANGKTAAAMLIDDRKRFPGGRMCGFMLFIATEIAEWKAANGVGASMSDRDHDDFTARLKEKHGQAKED